MVADERLIDKLYNAYDKAHANAGPIHVPNGGGDTAPAAAEAAAAAPPRNSVNGEESFFDKTTANRGRENAMDIRKVCKREESALYLQKDFETRAITFA